MRWDRLDTRAVAYANDDPLRARIRRALSHEVSQVNLARAFQVGLLGVYSYDIRQPDSQPVSEPGPDVELGGPRWY